MLVNNLVVRLSNEAPCVKKPADHGIVLGVPPRAERPKCDPRDQSKWESTPPPPSRVKLVASVKGISKKDDQYRTERDEKSVEEDEHLESQIEFGLSKDYEEHVR